MIICPYCKNEVDDKYEDQICPLCNNYVKSEKWLDTQSTSFIMYLRAKKMYDRLKIYVWNEETDNAINEIRRIMEKPDTMVEPVIISKILKDRPSDWGHTEAPPTLAKPVEQRPSVRLTACPACNHQISIKAETCPNCGNPTGVHICPKCGSTNTKAISGASKATSILLWGPFATNKVVSKYQCKDCWHKF